MLSFRPLANVAANMLAQSRVQTLGQPGGRSGGTLAFEWARRTPLTRRRLASRPCTRPGWRTSVSTRCRPVRMSRQRGHQLCGSEGAPEILYFCPRRGKVLNDKASPREANRLDDLRFRLAVTDDVRGTGDSWFLQDRGRRRAPEPRTVSTLLPPSLFFPGRSGGDVWGPRLLRGRGAFLIQKSRGHTFGVRCIVTDE